MYNWRPNYTKKDFGWRDRIERAIMYWLHDRFIERLLRRYGGIQKCPYCKQCAHAYDGTRYDSKTDPTIDALHCGNCGGVSRWRFELGMMPLTPIGHTPPDPDKEAKDGTGNED